MQSVNPVVSKFWYIFVISVIWQSPNPSFLIIIATMRVGRSCQCSFFADKLCVRLLVLLKGQQALLGDPPCMVFACMYYFVRNTAFMQSVSAVGSEDVHQ